MTPSQGPLGLNALAERLEAISSVYASHFGITRDRDWFLLKIQEELGELTQAFLRLTDRARGKENDAAAERLADEAADVLGQLLLLHRAMGVDFDAAVRRKWLRYEAAGDAS
ncbi:pyrophosphatase [Terrarubrum flagellatum]|uniref:pyrophosphatase n=1 Tax=Terrirubrum flagellatum TaxID=2895980 RepID=UPI0031456FCB